MNMQILQRVISQFYAAPSTSTWRNGTRTLNLKVVLSSRMFSTKSGGGGNPEGEWGNKLGGTKPSDDDLGWDVASSWSTGLTKEHFDGEAVGHLVTPGGTTEKIVPQFASTASQEIDYLKQLEEENRKGKAFVDGWGEKMRETSVLLKQVREPGARGTYLKDSEKAEMYRLHKENPEVYTVEKLARDYRIMRQRVHAILWLKEIEEEEEKKLGHPLDDSVELLLDTCPEFFNSHDREFHIASLPYKPDFKMAGKVKCHKYSRRRPDEGWNIMVEKLGPRGKRGNGGGWKFMSMPDGSSRALNEMEKMYVRRETPRRRRRILP
ncbi:Neugrin-like protein [Actinidia chinensis var. chinensis]|uniref:Neugrin-like protein n=1 Tax=Actinidia chinensis var. chinensis TaxID=1590841 RepID=A0A2R6PUN1_ACTCC|nr:Neugrin-like protein [Actinidia chinensis var. chinensis]